MNKADRNKQIQIIKEAREKIDAADTAEKIKANRKVLGKCYRYRNNYSVPTKPSDYWWLYGKIIRMDDDGDLFAVTFQKDTYGHVSIKVDERHYHNPFEQDRGYQEITTERHSVAWRDMKNYIASLG